jgi:protein involved in polysaccharide export with SLBB domain
MSRRSAFFGIAAALVFAGAPAVAQSAAPSTQYVPAQPRYATQIAPSQDSVLDSGPQAAAPPVAAPTIPVAVVAPADTSTQSPPKQWVQPRYATMDSPTRADETVTVLGLRQSQDSAYRLGTGDKVHITVFNQDDLSGDFQIDGQGYVRLPLIGQLPAAGLTTFALENHIADALSDGYLINPRVNVEVTSYRPFYIIGEVAKPGEYPYVNAMAAPNAIALAGGFTEYAAESTVYVRHQGEMKEHEEPIDQSTRIYPGDVLRVERSGYWSVMTLLSPLISPFSAIAYLLK